MLYDTLRLPVPAGAVTKRGRRSSGKDALKKLAGAHPAVALVSEHRKAREERGARTKGGRAARQQGGLERLLPVRCAQPPQVVAWGSRGSRARSRAPPSHAPPLQVADTLDYAQKLLAFFRAQQAAARAAPPPRAAPPLPGARPGGGPRIHVPLLQTNAESGGRAGGGRRRGARVCAHLLAAIRRVPCSPSTVPPASFALPARRPPGDGRPQPAVRAPAAPAAAALLRPRGRPRRRRRAADARGRAQASAVVMLCAAGLAGSGGSAPPGCSHEACTIAPHWCTRAQQRPTLPHRRLLEANVRAALVAGPGCVLLGADYRQMEARLMAHIRWGRQARAGRCGAPASHCERPVTVASHGQSR